MLAAAVLALWWAQAEPAPVEAAPAEPAPSAAPLTVAAAPEPAPADNRVAISGAFAYRLGSEGRAIGPAEGFSLGGDYERRYLQVAPEIELGVGLDFFYDKFQTGVTGTTTVEPGQEQTFPSERIISQTGFVLLQTVAWRHGRWRPFVQVGPGFTIAYFSTAESMFSPGTFNAVQPLVRVAGGLDVTITHDVGIVARVGFDYLFTRPTFTADAAAGSQSYSFLGNLFDAGLGVVFFF